MQCGIICHNFRETNIIPHHQTVLAVGVLFFHCPKSLEKQHKDKKASSVKIHLKRLVNAIASFCIMWHISFVVSHNANCPSRKSVKISYIHGLKSLDKYALLVLLRTHQTRIQLDLSSFTPHPTYSVQNQYLQFELIFNIVLGEEGNPQHAFKRIVALFFKLQMQKKEIIPMTFVHELQMFYET